MEEVHGRFTTIRLTDDGFAVLKQRKSIELAKPAKLPGRESRARQVVCDEMLLGRLTDLRKKLADELGLPPHVVLPTLLSEKWPPGIHAQSRNWPERLASAKRDSRILAQCSWLK
jgi:hypothetical protein